MLYRLLVRSRTHNKNSNQLVLKLIRQLLFAGFQGIGVPNSWTSLGGSCFCDTTVRCWKGKILDDDLFYLF